MQPDIPPRTPDDVSCHDALAVRRRVLVVDDEPLIRWCLSETLRHCGFTIVEAQDARTALLAAHDTKNRFQIAVLDVKLPDSGDLTLLAQLRQLIPDTRIIVMTAHGTPALAQEVIDLGAYCMLAKPFEMDTFGEIVREASDGPV